MFPHFPHSSILRSMQIPNSSWHAESSIRLQHRGNKFSLRIFLPVRAETEVWIYVFIVSRNWNKWGDLVWEDRLPVLIRSPTYPPTPSPALWGVSVMKSAAAPLCCAQPLSSLTNPYFTGLLLRRPPSPSLLLSRLPSSYRWFHRLAAAAPPPTHHPRSLAVCWPA